MNHRAGESGDGCEYVSLAKINLGLYVVGKRDDGYHDIETVMQSIDLGDRLRFRRISSGISVDCDHPGVPRGEGNIVVTAAKALFERYGIGEGVSISIEKRIPVAAGLAGGSGNAAVTLHAVNRLWNLGLTTGELAEIGTGIGADVPFQLYGGTCFARGIGAELLPVRSEMKPWFVLLFPPFEISTAWAYAHVRVRRRRRSLVERLESCNFNITRELILGLENDFEDLVFREHPSLKTLRDRLVENGACRAFMSGSGPTLFGIYDDEAAARSCAAQFESEIPLHLARDAQPDYFH